MTKDTPQGPLVTGALWMSLPLTVPLILTLTATLTLTLTLARCG